MLNIGCSDENHDEENRFLTATEMGSIVTNKLITLPECGETITIIEQSRPRYVFYEGANRALLFEKDGEYIYFPFRNTSAGERTVVDIYQLGDCIYLLKDKGVKRKNVYILNLKDNELYLKVFADKRYFIVPIALRPVEVSRALASDKVLGISPAVFYPVDKKEVSVTFEGKDLEPLPEKYSGKGAFVDTIRSVDDSPIK